MRIEHPVLDHQIDRTRAAEYEKTVDYAMKMDEAELLTFVPKHGYVSSCECPVCYGGVQGSNIYLWSIDHPDDLKCRYCGAQPTPSDLYQEEHTLSGNNVLGEEVRLSYYLNAERDIPHFFSMHLQLYRRRWLLDQCITMGKAYQATGKETYADRLMLVLDRFAQVYPHYPALHNRSSRGVRFCELQTPPFSWDAGRWGYFHNEIPKEVIAAYDLIYHSESFDKLSAARGYNVRERLVDDFFRKTYEVAAASAFHVGNVVGYDVTGVAMLGRVIEEPAYVHQAFGWMKQNVDEGFFPDGWWHEAPSYHYMTIGGLRQAFDSVRGYSDPPGYLYPEDGTRLEDTNPEKELPFWRSVQHAPEALSFPDGSSTPVHDTWAGDRRSEPRARTRSTIAPAYGQASLGRGENGDQMQAQLHFSGAYGHHHFDNLGLTLFAKGSEMLSDVGYTWTQMRHWCNSTLGHNTVVVDRTSQNSGDSDGDLLCFFPDSNGVCVVEADGKRGYSGIEGVSRYRRTLAMVPVSESDAYVVDIFRVVGGRIHDWALHGDADRDMSATCDLDLGEELRWMLEPDETWEEPTIIGATYNPYGLVRDVRMGVPGGMTEVEFKYADEPNRGVRIHVGADGHASPESDQQIWLGRAPSVRRMGKGTNADMRTAYEFWMPQLVLRHRGDSPIATTFVAVHEPFRDGRFVDRVELLDSLPADDGSVALQVSHAEGVDTIISTLDQPPYPDRTTSSGIQLRGRMGIVRQLAGVWAGSWLFEGNELTSDGRQLALDNSRYSGQIVASTRLADGADENAFVVDIDFSEEDDLHGSWMIVTHGNGFTHGYEIDRLETRDGQSCVVLTQDHGLRVSQDATEEVYFPCRRIEGPNTFVIPRSASATR